MPLLTPATADTSLAPRKRTTSRLLLGTTSILGLLIAWVVATMVTDTINTSRFPSPLQFWQSTKQIMTVGYADGTLIGHLRESSALANREPTNPLPVPMATWVHFEIFYKKAPDATGRITIWQDGTQILDLPNVVTAPNAWTQWDIGGASNDVSPAATVYFDDAAISLTRLGPQG